MTDSPPNITAARALDLVRSRCLTILVKGLLLGILFNSVVYAGESPAAPDLPLLIAMVGELQVKLGIPDRIEIVLVEKNERVISVNRNPNNKNHFRISVEQSFLNLLTISETRAALAHELGHVWIFTHHPYLQTEDLANQIAGKVVSSEELNHIVSMSAAYLTQRKKSLDSALASSPLKPSP